MASQTEGKNIGDVLKFEEKAKFSREAFLVDQSQTIVLGQVCKTGPGGRKIVLGAPADDVQTIAITGTLSAGSFTLVFTDEVGAVIETDPIAYNANTAAVQTGVDSALGAAAVVVSGTAITGMIFTFSGIEYSGVAQEMIAVDGSVLTGVEDITVTHTTIGGQGSSTAVDAVQTGAIGGTLTGGTWLLSLYDLNDDLVTTAAIAYNASTANIQTAIDTLLGTTDDIVAGGTAITAMTFTFSGAGYEGRAHKLMSIDGTLLTTSDPVRPPITMVHTTLGHPGGESQADCIALAAVTTGAGVYTTKATFLARHAIVDRQQLEFGSGNAVDAIASLAEVGIIVRDEA